MLFASLTFGCDGLRTRPNELDGGGGMAGGSSTAGGSTAGGSSTAGGNMAGGSGAHDAGLRELTWGKMSPPAANAYQGLWGIGSGASVILYANQHSSRIARFQNGQWKTVYQDPSNTNLVSLWASPNEEVFSVGSFHADACLADCSQPASWRQATLPTLTLTGVCGGRSLQHVYAVGNTSLGRGALVKFDPTNVTWAIVSSDTGSTTNAGCWVGPDDAVYIAAQSTVVRYDGFGFTPETIAFPASWSVNDRALMFVEVVAGSGSDVYAAGSGKRVMWRDAPGHWAFVFDPGSTSPFRGLAVSTAGALAAGSNLGADPIAAHGVQAAWAWQTTAPDLAAWSVWAATPDEVYLAGYASGAGAIYRGTR
ncbi:MAG: hypothetical protein JNK82_30385 [Myxococcaceae bacterium]|nr:hypothetical protein [Myxococcaceae bacterium]